MGNGGKIDFYVDCNSPFSFMAYTHLRRNRKTLASHGIDIELHPIFLGGIMNGSGNKPPWTLPAKAAHGKYDNPRAQKWFQTGKMTAPSFFPIMSLLPMRAFLYVKDHYPYQQFEDAFGELWVFLWQEHKDVSKPEVLRECLMRHFSKDDAEKILKAGADPEYKRKLNDETARLVQRGAYGAPWYFVTNKHGVQEPFFGSDRFHFMWQFLELPIQDLQILPPGSTSKI